MTLDEAIKIIKRYDVNFCDNDGNPISAELLSQAFDTAIKSLEADRAIEKTLYAIREEMQCIKTAEFQMYGEYSFRFANAIEGIINRHLSELEGDIDER